MGGCAMLFIAFCHLISLNSIYAEHRFKTIETLEAKERIAYLDYVKEQRQKGKTYYDESLDVFRPNIPVEEYLMAGMGYWYKVNEPYHEWNFLWQLVREPQKRRVLYKNYYLQARTFFKILKEESKHRALLYRDDQGHMHMFEHMANGLQKCSYIMLACIVIQMFFMFVLIFANMLYRKMSETLLVRVQIRARDFAITRRLFREQDCSRLYLLKADMGEGEGEQAPF